MIKSISVIEKLAPSHPADGDTTTTITTKIMMTMTSTNMTPDKLTLYEQVSSPDNGIIYARMLFKYCFHIIIINNDNDDDLP